MRTTRTGEIFALHGTLHHSRPASTQDIDDAAAHLRLFQHLGGHVAAEEAEASTAHVTVTYYGVCRSDTAEALVDILHQARDRGVLHGEITYGWHHAEKLILNKESQNQSHSVIGTLKALCQLFARATS